MVKMMTEACLVGWNKSERAKVRELCFVWIGTADAWLKNRVMMSIFTDKNNVVFLDVTPCNPVEMKRRFKGNCTVSHLRRW